MTFSFVIPYWQRDADLAQKCKAAVEAVYPGAQVALVEDSPRLKLPQFCGQWTARWMKAAPAADVTVKLDPDTRAFKPAAKIPSADVFGRFAAGRLYNHAKQDRVVMGAAIGFTAAAMQKILASGYLLDAKYAASKYNETREGRTRETLSLQDPIVADVAARLKLSVAEWDEVCLKFSWEKPDASPQAWAFAHPVTA